MKLRTRPENVATMMGRTLIFFFLFVGAPSFNAQVATPAQQEVTIAPRTSAELRARIQAVTQQPQLASAQFAVKVASLETGRVLYEENATKLMQPASNMKLYTVAAALDRLTPAFRFKTSVYARSLPDERGTLHGDLTIYGRGDPSIAASFNNGDYYAGVDALAARIAAIGIKRIGGDLIGDETYFAGAPFGNGWEWEDLQWEYGAEVSALTVNDNTLDLFVAAGQSAGAPCTVTFGPPIAMLSVINRTTTSIRGTKRDLIVYRNPGENTITIGGSLPLGDPGFTTSVTLSHPAQLFVALLRQALEKRGIAITGRTRIVDARSSSALEIAAANAGVVALKEIASLQSPTLGRLAAETLKPSQNLYAELILRALGRATITTNGVLNNSAPLPMGVMSQTAPTQTATAQVATSGTNLSRDSAAAGIEAVSAFLLAAGVAPESLRINDGSGLSRGDLITADATLKLLIYMDRHRDAIVFRDALPVAGAGGTLREGGTLRNRMKNTPAAGNVRAKTGTIDGVASLSGYVTSAAGERLAFSILLNNDLEDSGARREYLDQIAVLLASYKGRS